MIIESENPPELFPQRRFNEHFGKQIWNQQDLLIINNIQNEISII